MLQFVFSMLCFYVVFYVFIAFLGVHIVHICPLVCLGLAIV